jgi:hypothetical protein
LFNYAVVSLETLNLDPENTAVNRFDNLLRIITEGQTGWVSLPQRNIYRESEVVPARIFAYNPNPKRFTKDYNPPYSQSLYVELGERTYLDEGKPAGEVLKLGIKKNYLQRAMLDESQMHEVEQELEMIEEIVLMAR